MGTEPNEPAAPGDDADADPGTATTKTSTTAAKTSATAARSARVRKPGVRDSPAPTKKGPEKRAVDAGDEDVDDASRRPAGGGGLARIRGRISARPVLSAAVALVVLAAACAAYFGAAWYRAAHSDSIGFSQTRDRVLIAGEQAVQNLNTLDYRQVDRGLNRWLQSSTGDLHKSISSGRSDFVKQIKKAKTITTAKVLDGAVTKLDRHAGKAAVLVALQITVDPHKGKTTTKQSRLSAQLTRTGHGWKLSGIGQVPIRTGTGAKASATPSPSSGA